MCCGPELSHSPLLAMGYREEVAKLYPQELSRPPESVLPWTG